MKKPAHHGVRAKHSSRKHGGTSKHAAKHLGRGHRIPVAGGGGGLGPPPAVGKAPSKPKPRKLTPDGSVALCSARAVAESLRLALGVVASDDDVLALYFATVSDPDEGASILATLHAAATFGLAGARLPEFRQTGGVPALNEQVVADLGDDLAVLQFGQGIDEHLLRREAAQFEPLGGLVADRPSVHALILGLALPEGDHAVLATPDAWWSWGQPYDPSAFAGAVIEEACTVRWAA